MKGTGQLQDRTEAGVRTVRGRYGQLKDRTWLRTVKRQDRTGIRTVPIHED